jgi:hypothetical protein
VGGLLSGGMGVTGEFQSGLQFSISGWKANYGGKT